MSQMPFADAMAMYQRKGVGLELGFDGHWHARFLSGLEKEQVELAVNADKALTEHVCEVGGKVMERPGVAHIYLCPACGTYTAVDGTGMVMPHSYRVNP